MLLLCAHSLMGKMDIKTTVIFFLFNDPSFLLLEVDFALGAGIGHDPD